MIEIEDVSLAVAKGNKVSALTMLRQAKFAQDAQPYRAQTEMYILADDMKLAQKCLDIAAIKTQHPQVKFDCDETELLAATALVEKHTEVFNEPLLDSAIDHMYECLLNLAKDTRGLDKH